MPSKFAVKPYRKKLVEKLKWAPLATFIPNKNLPVYNWFYYKEGFSRELVLKLLEMFQLKEGNWVLDPFCGCGTTLLACKELGINSIGFDVLPISVFASRVKVWDYDTQKLKSQAKELLKQKFRPTKTKFPKSMPRFFSKHILDDIAFFKEKIDTMPDRDFFLLALITTAIKCSWVWKDGGVLKVRKKPTPPLRDMLRRIIYRMIKDLDRIKFKKAKNLVDFGDARKLRLQNNCIDAVITSPPYLNQIDYTKVYEIENWFVSRPRPALRSFMGLGSESEFLPELKIPPQARAYFKDMDQFIKEIYRVCKKGARAGIVVGNAYFQKPEQIAESDLILSYLAEKAGFKVNKIYVLNKRFALERRTIKKGVLRESLILLEK